MEIGGKKIPLFGVFDGHGGAECSAFLEEKLPEYLQEKLTPLLTKPVDEQELAIVNMLKIAFVELSDQYKENYPDSTDGSTACMTMILNDKIYTANVGDTRAILSVADQEALPAIALSQDAETLKHKHSAEKRGGNIISFKGTEWRLPSTDGEKFLETARSVGDQDVKGVNSRAQVTVYALSELEKSENPILVIACDGLWDFVSSNEFSTTLQAMRKENMSLEDISKKILAKVWNTKMLKIPRF